MMTSKNNGRGPLLFADACDVPLEEDTLDASRERAWCNLLLSIQDVQYSINRLTNRKTHTFISIWWTFGVLVCCRCFSPPWFWCSLFPVSCTKGKYRRVCVYRRAILNLGRGEYVSLVITTPNPILFHFLMLQFGFTITEGCTEAMCTYASEIKH